MAIAARHEGSALFPFILWFFYFLFYYRGTGIDGNRTGQTELQQLTYHTLY